MEGLYLVNITERQRIQAGLSRHRIGIDHCVLRISHPQSLTVIGPQTRRLVVSRLLQDINVITRQPFKEFHIIGVDLGILLINHPHRLTIRPNPPRVVVAMTPQIDLITPLPTIGSPPSIQFSCIRIVIKAHRYYFRIIPILPPFARSMHCRYVHPRTIRPKPPRMLIIMV